MLKRQAGAEIKIAPEMIRGAIEVYRVWEQRSMPVGNAPAFSRDVRLLVRQLASAILKHQEVVTIQERKQEAPSEHHALCPSQ